MAPSFLPNSIDLTSRCIRITLIIVPISHGEKNDLLKTTATSIDLALSKANIQTGNYDFYQQNHASFLSGSPCFGNYLSFSPLIAQTKEGQERMMSGLCLSCFLQLESGRMVEGGLFFAI